jgi:hypothetical protein
MSNGNTLNLYLISQTVNDDYDTFDSAVVAARDEEDARSIHPISSWLGMGNIPTVTQTAREAEEEKEKKGYNSDDTWTTRENVKVRFLGICSPDVKRGVICASYNAG